MIEAGKKYTYVGGGDTMFVPEMEYLKEGAHEVADIKPAIFQDSDHIDVLFKDELLDLYWLIDVHDFEEEETDNVRILQDLFDGFMSQEEIDYTDKVFSAYKYLTDQGKDLHKGVSEWVKDCDGKTVEEMNAMGKLTEIDWMVPKADWFPYEDEKEDEDEDEEMVFSIYKYMARNRETGDFQSNNFTEDSWPYKCDGKTSSEVPFIIHPTWTVPKSEWIPFKKPVRDHGFTVLMKDYFLTEMDISAIAGISRDKDSIPSVIQLLEWGHFSPLEFARVIFYVECPIFVSRQLMRHRTGVYMERSLRYARPENFYLPDSIMDNKVWDEYFPSLIKMYPKLVEEEGISEEDARSILPMGTMTKFYVEYDLRNFINLCLLRLDSHAQKETREIVQKMLDSIEPLYPSVHRYIVKQMEDNK